MADMIEYMQSHEGVWFATGSEVAEWWLTQNFSQVPLPRVSARAAGGVTGLRKKVAYTPNLLRESTRTRLPSLCLRRLGTRRSGGIQATLDFIADKEPKAKKRNPTIRRAVIPGGDRTCRRSVATPRINDLPLAASLRTDTVGISEARYRLRRVRRRLRTGGNYMRVHEPNHSFLCAHVPTIVCDLSRFDLWADHQIASVLRGDHGKLHARMDRERQGVLRKKPICDVDLVLIESGTTNIQALIAAIEINTDGGRRCDQQRPSRFRLTVVLRVWRTGWLTV